MASLASSSDSPQTAPPPCPGPSDTGKGVAEEPEPEPDPSPSATAAAAAAPYDPREYQPTRREVISVTMPPPEPEARSQAEGEARSQADRPAAPLEGLLDPTPPARLGAWRERRESGLAKAAPLGPRRRASLSLPSTLNGPFHRPGRPLPPRGALPWRAHEARATVARAETERWRCEGARRSEEGRARGGWGLEHEESLSRVIGRRWVSGSVGMIKSSISKILWLYGRTSG